MGKPFRVYVDYGGASPAEYEITEELLREHTHLNVITAIAQQGPEDTDERTRLWRGAREIVRAMLEKNAAEPIRIYDGPDLWLIPDHAVRAARLHDPESKEKKGRGSIGFGRAGDD